MLINRLVTGLLLIIIGCLMLFTACTAFAYSGKQDRGDTFVTYPLTPDATPSTHFSVSIMGGESGRWTRLPVEEFRSISQVHFSFSGKVALRVEILPAKTKIANYDLSPHSYTDVKSRMQDPYTISIPINRPVKLYLHHINNWFVGPYGINEPVLCIFADSLEDDTPASKGNGIWNVIAQGKADSTGKTDATGAIQSCIDSANAAGKGIVYVPKGLYTISGLTMKRNVKLYIQGGARLKVGEIVPNRAVISYTKGADNTMLYGRGSIDASGIYHRYTMKPRSSVYYTVAPEESDNGIIEGITLVDPWTFALNLYNCGKWLVTNVKTIDYAGMDIEATAGVDGMNCDDSRDITFTDCFILSGDDCTSIKAKAENPRFKKSSNINYCNSVYVNRAMGAGLGHSDIQNVHVTNTTWENIDLCQSMWAFASQITVGSGKNAAITESYCKNIRIENNSRAVISEKADRAPMRNWYFWDIQDSGGWGSESTGGRRGNFIRGNPPVNLCDSFSLDHFFVDGKRVTDNKNIETNAYTTNLTFPDHEPVVVNVSATAKYAAWAGKSAAVFTFMRTGPTKDTLKINYTIRGLAKNGVDYQRIPATVIIPAGKKAAIIKIKPKSGTGIKTVELILRNDPYHLVWCTGPQYNALVTIR